MSGRLLLATAIVAAAVLAAPAAHADTVTGTFTFADTNGQPMPIVDAKVEVWRFRPMFVTWGAWTWNNDFTGATAIDGSFTTTLPFAVPGVVYGLRVFATNNAAQVFIQDNVFTPFWREPGLPEREIQRAVTTAFDPPMVFSANFGDDWARRHFNVADAIRIARNYADANRDPRETDTIGRVDVMMQGCCNTYYDPGAHLIRLGPQFHLDDLTIVHEYAHYLEDRISSFLGLASIHNGCDAGIVSHNGLAWMEGFAAYFAQTVSMSTGALFGPALGTSSVDLLERPFAYCGGSVPTAAREGHVAAVLWDLNDFLNESGDLACARDTQIFQIFDRELDIGWTNPGIELFANAWLGRGFDARPLLSAMTIAGITPPPVTTVHGYNPAAGADVAVWRPGSTGTWFVRGFATISQGTTGDVPVPADFDGDGVTDLAVFHPATGVWTIRKSMGGFVETIQWGTAGDVPLAGDRDGDGEAELIVYRPSSNTFFVHGDTCFDGAIVSSIRGQPAVGQFDSDGRADLAVYEPATGAYRVVLASGALNLATFPTGGTMMARDYDGDGRTDRGVYTTVNGTFHFDPTTGGARRSIAWGLGNELPAPADHDPTTSGDELATWSPTSGNWFIRRNNGSMMPVVQWGTCGDIPVASR